MSAQLGLHWRPSLSISYYNYYYGDLEAGEIPADGLISLSKDQYYGGSPYVTATSGTLYNFLHYAKPGNVLDIDAMKDAWGITGDLDPVTTNKILSVFSNQCSGSTYWAWSRVTPALDYHWTSNIIPRPRTGALDNATYTNGIVAVGDYDVNKGRENNPIVSYAEDGNQIATKTICEANGVDTMYKAYAQVQPGDGFVFWYTSNNAGHAMMAASGAFKADGTPLTDPSEADGSCYIYIFSQVDDWRAPDKNGVTYQTGTNYNGAEAGKLVSGWPTDYRVVKYTFNYLYNTNGSLPFTLEVFEDVSKFENAKLYSTTNLKDGIYYHPSALANAKIDSNYPISSVNIAVKDTSGKLVDTLHVYTRWAGAYNNYSFQFTRTDSNVTNWPAVEAKLANYYGHTLEISATVGTGETLHVATILLMHNNLMEDMADIPVANSSMSAAELRQIVLRTMATQITFQWQTDTEIIYSRNDDDDNNASTMKTNVLSKGVTYGGYRYISAKGGNGAPTGNPYIWMQMLDFSTATPTLRPEVVDKLIGDGVLDPTNWESTKDWIGAFFNQCSGTPFWAFSRVTGALTASYSSGFVPRNGFLTVIPTPEPDDYDSVEAYEYALERWNYLKYNETYMGRTDAADSPDGAAVQYDDFYDELLGKTVSHQTLKELVLYCRAFGEKLMYRAYSLCQPADGALTNHDLMIYSVNTVYDNNGNIDPDKSTITFIDQAADWKSTMTNTGATYSSQSVGVLVGGATLTKTFRDLYVNAYLPYTLAVYEKPALVEEAKIIYDGGEGDDPDQKNTNFSDGKEITVADLLTRYVDANYPVAIITAKLIGSNETVSVYTKMAAGNANKPTRIGVDDNTRGVENFTEVLNGWVKANNNSVAVEITATVGSGQELHVADITLVAAQ